MSIFLTHIECFTFTVRPTVVSSFSTARGRVVDCTAFRSSVCPSVCSAYRLLLRQRQHIIKKKHTHKIQSIIHVEPKNIRNGTANDGQTDRRTNAGCNLDLDLDLDV